MKTKLRTLLTTAFWTGVVVFILGQVITFYPGAETGWFVLSTVLCLCGFGLRHKAYTFATLLLVASGIALSVAGYRHGEHYRLWLGKQPSKEEQVQHLQEHLRLPGGTNTSPDRAVDGNQPLRSQTNSTPSAVGSHR